MFQDFSKRKTEHSEKVFSTDFLLQNSGFSPNVFPRVLEEHCTILVQSIAKNNTEVLRNTQVLPGDFPWGFS